MAGADRLEVSEGPGPLARRLASLRRLAVESEPLLEALLALVVVLLVLATTYWPTDIPISLLFPLVVVSGLVLGPTRLVRVYALALVGVTLWVPGAGLEPLRLVLFVSSILVVMVMMTLAAQSRARVGTRGFGGDRMFADLRDRIASVGRMPDLPEGWRTDSCVLSAHGERFSGDFVVAHLSPSQHRLEVVLVDVSGKGTRAGTRSLLLSGALGALLGAVPSADFLRAANDYLVRQEWEEGFATAVHLDLDLRTGEYSVANAGHPAPARYTGGRARWSLLEGSRGPLLGVVANVAFPRQSGRLERGDALLFYSDGVIESRGRDLDDGIDRMLGVASMAVLGAGDVAREVCEASRSGEDDDRAALAVRRL
ncbi:PP2C family protein-serine/threonine phosphatase [Oryzobacter sp. R7]|uniref:PP2C family protein-serine/threonine phosphatase n=1 Tax=Oryzobacter faecalis TaxID=3388656 RepID=UPI00398D21C7